MKDDLLKIINYYDVIHQLRKFNEESYELIEAIRDYVAEIEKPFIKQPINPCLRDSILEELADVCVLLAQFKEYFGFTEDEIIDEMIGKIQRQQRRINDEI